MTATNNNDGNALAAIAAQFKAAAAGAPPTPRGANATARPSGLPLARPVAAPGQSQQARGAGPSAGGPRLSTAMVASPAHAAARLAAQQKQQLQRVAQGAAAQSGGASDSTGAFAFPSEPSFDAPASAPASPRRGHALTNVSPFATAGSIATSPSLSAGVGHGDAPVDGPLLLAVSLAATSDPTTAAAYGSSLRAAAAGFGLLDAANASGGGGSIPSSSPASPCANLPVAFPTAPMGGAPGLRRSVSMLSMPSTPSRPTNAPSGAANGSLGAQRCSRFVLDLKRLVEEYTTSRRPDALTRGLRTLCENAEIIAGDLTAAQRQLLSGAGVPSTPRGMRTSASMRSVASFSDLSAAASGSFVPDVPDMTALTRRAAELVVDGGAPSANGGGVPSPPPAEVKVQSLLCAVAAHVSAATGMNEQQLRFVAHDAAGVSQTVGGVSGANAAGGLANAARRSSPAITSLAGAAAAAAGQQPAQRLTSEALSRHRVAMPGVTTPAMNADAISMADQQSTVSRLPPPSAFNFPGHSVVGAGANGLPRASTMSNASTAAPSVTGAKPTRTKRITEVAADATLVLRYGEEMEQHRRRALEQAQAAAKATGGAAGDDAEAEADRIGAAATAAAFLGLAGSRGGDATAATTAGAAAQLSDDKKQVFMPWMQAPPYRTGVILPQPTLPAHVACASFLPPSGGTNAHTDANADSAPVVPAVGNKKGKSAPPPAAAAAAADGRATSGVSATLYATWIEQNKRQGAAVAASGGTGGLCAVDGVPVDAATAAAIGAERITAQLDAVAAGQDPVEAALAITLVNSAHFAAASAASAAAAAGAGAAGKKKKDRRRQRESEGSAGASGAPALPPGVANRFEMAVHTLDSTLYAYARAAAARRSIVAAAAPKQPAGGSSAATSAAAFGGATWPRCPALALCPPAGAAAAAASSATAGGAVDGVKVPIEPTPSSTSTGDAPATVIPHVPTAPGTIVDAAIEPNKDGGDKPTVALTKKTATFLAPTAPSAAGKKGASSGIIFPYRGGGTDDSVSGSITQGGAALRGFAEHLCKQYGIVTLAAATQSNLADAATDGAAAAAPAAAPAAAAGAAPSSTTALTTAAAAATEDTKKAPASTTTAPAAPISAAAQLKAEKAEAQKPQHPLLSPFTFALPAVTAARLLPASAVAAAAASMQVKPVFSFDALMGFDEPVAAPPAAPQPSVAANVGESSSSDSDDAAAGAPANDAEAKVGDGEAKGETTAADDADAADNEGGDDAAAPKPTAAAAKPLKALPPPSAPPTGVAIVPPPRLQAAAAAAAAASLRGGSNEAAASSLHGLVRAVESATQRAEAVSARFAVPRTWLNMIIHNGVYCTSDISDVIA